MTTIVLCVYVMLFHTSHFLDLLNWNRTLSQYPFQHLLCTEQTVKTPSGMSGKKAYTCHLHLPNALYSIVS
jgi:hypothetical protein